MASRRLLIPLLGLFLVLPAGLPVVAQETAPTGNYLQVLDVTYPTRPDAGLSDTYDACRSGCERIHKAADLMGERMWPLYAMVDGVVCRINDGAEDSYGRNLTLCGDDGRRYRYLHLNNDTPGTDDGQAGLEHVYATGMRKGLRVARGQLVAYMGDSGNAEGTAPHLHLDIFDDTVVDPYGDNRINPYPSLVAALARGDVPDGTAYHADPAARLSGDDRVATAVALAEHTPVVGDTVVLARHDEPTDALVAGPLAGALDAPVLITPPDHLDDRVAAEVSRRGASRAILVGPELSSRVEASLADLGLDVERVAGQNRYRTADAVAQYLWGLDGTGPGLAVPDGGGAIEPGEVDPEDPGTDPDDPDPEEDGPAPELALQASTSADRSDPQDLAGATVAGRVSVFLGGDDLPDLLHDVRNVTFWLDGEEVNRERYFPYDLLGSRDSWNSRGDGEANRLDTTELDDGPHDLRARVRFHDDGALEIEVGFTVANGSPRSAILALGDHDVSSRQWPDALMGSWLGAATATPILLTSPTRVPEATALLLEDASRVTVVGGTGAIADDLVDGLPVQRLWGDDRYGTAVAVADALVRSGLAETDRTWAATGRNWPDAIAAGPAVAAAGDVLVLVDGDARGGSEATSTWLHRTADAVVEGLVIGGGSAVTETAMQVFRLDVT